MVAILKFANFPTRFKKLLAVRCLSSFVELVIIVFLRELDIHYSSGELTSNSQLPIAFYENALPLESLSVRISLKNFDGTEFNYDVNVDPVCDHLLARFLFF